MQYKGKLFKMYFHIASSNGTNFFFRVALLACCPVFVCVILDAERALAAALFSIRGT